MRNLAAFISLYKNAGRYEESLANARELDGKAKDRSYKKPRLFGIPLSVKEQIEVGKTSLVEARELIKYS